MNKTKYQGMKLKMVNEWESEGMKYVQIEGTTYVRLSEIKKDLDKISKILTREVI